MKSVKSFLLIFVALVLGACDDTHFRSTWSDPSAPTVDLRHKTAAAFLISQNESVRRSFELNLANQLTERGIETLPGYEVLPNTDVTNQNAVLSKLRGKDVDVGVFMRVVDQRQEISFVPGMWYGGPYYDPFWWRYGAFYGPGFAGSWPPYYDSGYYQTDTIVSVETLVYSVPDGKLLWGGVSETMNPSKVPSFVKDLVSETAKKLKKTGMLTETS